MSAQPVGELSPGAEPPWLKAEPRKYWVTFWLDRPSRSICSICPYFSLAVICATKPSARVKHAWPGNGALGWDPPAPLPAAPPVDPLVPAALPPAPPPADAPPLPLDATVVFPPLPPPPPAADPPAPADPPVPGAPAVLPPKP